MLVVLAVVGCSARSAPEPVRSGVALSSCRSVVPGATITGDQMLDGCRDDDGTVLPIAHYPCRGTGNVVAVLERDGKAWSGEVRLDWHEEPVRGRDYGTWGGGFPTRPDSGFDAAGCVTELPEPVASG